MPRTYRYHNGRSDPSQVFVFGSNLLGQHFGGAALFANQHRGARMTIGQGYTHEIDCDGGMLHSYALPTMIMPGMALPLGHIRGAVELFRMYAYIRQDLTFFVTAVGTGIAGFTHEQIAPLFTDVRDNCLLPPEWKAILEPT